MDEKELLSSIIKMRCGAEQGTCFLFHDKRHVLTAKHVVVTPTGDQAGDIFVEVVPEPVKAITCKALSTCDVALVGFDRDLPGTPLEPVATDADDPRSGTEFRAPGFPAYLPEKWQTGKLVGGGEPFEYQLLLDPIPNVQLSGLSGAPVFDVKHQDRVLGVFIEHNPTNPSAGKMVPLRDFRTYLDFSGPRADFTCFVVLSDKEPEKNGVLRTAVGDARKSLDGVKNKDWRGEIDLKLSYATACVSSAENYADTVRELCRADVCIFDLTGYEPAVMLLLGIRSVVKRSITIGTTSGDITDAPYDIKELSLVDLANVAKKGLNLGDILESRIRAGRSAQGLQHYLDLPTFDAVRNLPPGRRGEVLELERVLVLSSYDPKADENFKYIQGRLYPELKGRGVGKPNISRVIDLNVESPWLVSQNMYEAIRRTAKCIVDWTGFPGNVFFELGVRIAVRSKVTISILRDAAEHEQSTTDDGRTEQQRNLIKLFKPTRYRTTDATGEEIAKMMQYWDGWPIDSGEVSEYTFRLITDAIVTHQGVTARGVVNELLESAELLSADSTEALSGVLYPQNRMLSAAARKAEIERLWAAWHYLDARIGLSKIAKNDELGDAEKRIVVDHKDVLGRIVVSLKDVLGQDDSHFKLAQDTLKKVLELAK